MYILAQLKKFFFFNGSGLFNLVSREKVGLEIDMQESSDRGVGFCTPAWYVYYLCTCLILHNMLSAHKGLWNDCPTHLFVPGSISTSPLIIFQN